MSEDSTETLLFTLSVTKNNIVLYTENLLQLLRLVTADENIKQFPECLSYLQNIEQSSLVLKLEVIKLLGKELTIDKLKNAHLSHYLSKIRMIYVIRLMPCRAMLKFV